MKPVRYLDPAEYELYETAEYYESIRDGLGFSFLDQVQSALNSIVENPSSWAEIAPNIRRRLVNRFPDGILIKNLQHNKGMNFAPFWRRTVVPPAGYAAQYHFIFSTASL